MTKTIIWTLLAMAAVESSLADAATIATELNGMPCKQSELGHTVFVKSASEFPCYTCIKSIGGSLLWIGQTPENCNLIHQALTY